MESYKYLIVGGGIGGGRGADGIRKADEEGSIALVVAEQHYPYQRPPLSKAYLMGKADLDAVYLRDEGYYEENDIEIIAGVRATQIDRKAREVSLSDGRVLGYEKLLLATGGRAWRLPLPGNELEQVYTLRTIDDSQAIRKAGGDGVPVLVLGGSFIGSEVASSLTQMGSDVTMAFPEGRLLERVVPEELSDLLHTIYADRGIRILPGIVADALKGKGRVERAELDNGETLAAELVVMGAGIRLNTELAKHAGLDLNEQGAVLVDEHLRTSDENIWAVGDIASWPDPTFGKRLRVEHWDVARRQGLHAGRVMAGEERAYDQLPYFYSDIFDLSFEVWGDLSAWERTVLRGSLEDGSFAYYYFAEGRLTGVLMVNRPDEERKPAQALVRARVTYDEMARKLQDEAVELGTLVDSEGPEAGSAQKTEGDQAEGGISYAVDIRPMFREKDIEEMKSASGLDLSNYEMVRQRANAIHERLSGGSMPCDGPWSEEKLAKFRRWIEQGKQP